jgi:hypothetical protein
VFSFLYLHLELEKFWACCRIGTPIWIFLVSSFSHSFRSCLEFALVCQLGLKLDLRFFTLGGVGA